MSVKTTCKDCYFAIRLGEEQVACELGRLQKFIDENSAIKEDSGWYSINRMCNTARSKEWADRQIGDKKSAVLREVQVSVDIVINCIDTEVDIIKISQTVKSCLRSFEIKPVKIIIAIRNLEFNKYTELNLALSDILGDTIPLQIIRIINVELTKEEALDTALKRSSSFFFCIMKSGDILRNDLLTSVDKAMNQDLKRFIIVKDGETTLVANNLYRTYKYECESIDVLVDKVVEGTKESKYNFIHYA